MKRMSLAVCVGAGLGLYAAPLSAQTFAAEEPVLRRIWEEGMNNSQLPRLAQTLLDSLGPRLTGTPGKKAAHDWAVTTYQSWGIPARNEQYGTWTGWRRGITHVDLLEPRVRTLEATLLAWSPPTQGPVSGPVAILPQIGSASDFEAWLPQARGRFVMISFPQPTCRPDENWERWAPAETFQRMRDERAAAQQAWNRSLQNIGLPIRDLPRRLEEAGALGILTSNWSEGWGVNKIFNARTQRVPTLDLGCEDYGLLARLARNDQGPVIRVNAEAEFLGEVPTYNTLAEIRGRERPNEYVMLSAHFDSWDGASGATDNGSGTVIMMEALRILQTLGVQPRRTILAGHWGGEEQGLNGSRAFVQDNPRIVNNLQALFNQDNGTGRIANISMQGFTRAEGHFTRWLARIPPEITQHISLEAPGVPSTGGTDHASFVCAGAPAFNLSSLSWDYRTYTWHTNRDSYDKLAFDELRNNATLVAMLVYLASEDPQRVPRDRLATLPADTRTGQPTSWPACAPAVRRAADSPRM